MGLGACASVSRPAPVNPATGDAEFVWGCWVSKDEPGGRVLAFLRLLKDHPESRAYRGYLHDVRGDEMIPVLRFTILRDGTHAAVVDGAETTEFASNGPVGQRIDYLSATPGQPGNFTLSGGDDRLAITLQLGSNSFAYTFERDGCD